MDYQDPDGYYFLQELWLCSENGRLDWTYFAPEDFKVLLYFPQTGEFVSGGIERAYAYDSYYTATFTDGGIALERSEVCRHVAGAVAPREMLSAPMSEK